MIKFNGLNIRELFCVYMKPISSGRKFGGRPHAVQALMGFTILMILICPQRVLAQNQCPGIGTASYYTVASCLREGTSGIMANNEVLNDNNSTAASWFHPFGTRLKVSRLDKKGKTLSSVIVVVKDRGPAKRLVRKGRIIDLSARAFAELAPLSEGVIRVKVEKI